MVEYKVSIIVPTYKRRSELVKRAVDSLLMQSYENIEIVIVDDNAKSEHSEFRKSISDMITEYSSDKIIYFQNKTNLGGALARNEGIFASSGDYITFLDDDDRYLPYKIENQLNCMIENNYDVSFTNLRIHNENDKLIDFREHSKMQAYDNDYLFKYHLTRQIAGTNTFMYKRETLLAVNGFDDVCMGQEFYLMAKTIKSGAKMGYCNTTDVVLYRFDIEAISTGPNKIKGEKLLYKYKKDNFKILSFKQKRFIVFRHHVVMAIAYKRNKKMFKSIGHLFIACVYSPINAIAEVFHLRANKKKNKKIIIENG